MGKPVERSAIIVGGSMSGLLAGLLLRRAGWDIEIFERVDSELAGRGAGIVAQPELIVRLHSLGLRPERLGVEVTTRRVFDAQGAVIEELACPQILTSWERVYRLLRDAFPAEHYHRGRGVSGFTQDAAAVTAHFSDGSGATADLLVGADGIRSTIRQQMLPAVTHAYAGYSAWRALVAEDALPQNVLREVFPFMSFGLPPGEQFLAYPVAGPDNELRPGHRRMNVIWYRPADEQDKLPWLLTDARGVTHELSIPPALIRREAIAEMRRAAEESLAPQFKAIVRQIAEPLLQPIYDLETPQMAIGRVAIVGDAAFVARPHVGAGVSKAADDAAALTRALVAQNDVVSALKEFEAARLPDNRRIIERARHLGAYLQATRTQEEQARAGQHSTAAAVLAETALIDFLRA